MPIHNEKKVPVVRCGKRLWMPPVLTMETAAVTASKVNTVGETRFGNAGPVS